MTIISMRAIVTEAFGSQSVCLFQNYMENTNLANLLHVLLVHLVEITASNSSLNHGQLLVQLSKLLVCLRPPLPETYCSVRMGRKKPHEV